MKKIPRSPFATRLSGSAREIELRIRSIFQWKKQRPPLALFLLMLVIGLLCGNLVSCQSSPAGVPEDPPAQSGEAWSTRSVLDALSQCFDAAESFPDGMERELLDTVGTGEDVTLAAAHFYDRYPRYSLVIGMVDRAGQVVGTPFEVRGSGGRPYVAAFVKDGVEYLLYTGSSAHQAYSSGQAGVIRLDGGDFSWVWPVEGDIRDESSQAYRDYNAYWEEKKPLMAPGGVDIFTENQDYGSYEGSPVQWVPHHNETFWYTAEQDLPIGVYYQSRGWLEEFTRHERNPWNALNTSALWQIVSLAPADGVYRDRNYDGEAVYELKARADSGEDLWFAASLLFDHSGERPIQVQGWRMGTKAEIDSAGGGPIRSSRTRPSTPCSGTGITANTPTAGGILFPTSPAPPGRGTSDLALSLMSGRSPQTAGQQRSTRSSYPVIRSTVQTRMTPAPGTSSPPTPSSSSSGWMGRAYPPRCWASPPRSPAAISRPSSMRPSMAYSAVM